MQQGRKKGRPGSKTEIVKAYYSEKTFAEALELSNGLDAHTARVIWTVCKRVDEFVYLGAADVRDQTGLDRWTCDFIINLNVRKRRREKVKAKKNEPKIYLTSKQYYHSV